MKGLLTLNSTYVICLSKNHAIVLNTQIVSIHIITLLCFTSFFKKNKKSYNRAME
ncbi:hypothetical protein HanIR_Chr09g0444381 [Helianthus annuus]|nr:hypothetical protein HanIR_Chr09g0444381 [Helianthus annuus]